MKRPYISKLFGIFGYPVPPDRSPPPPETYGVYFLWIDCEIAYVGQSMNLRQRCVENHPRWVQHAQFTWLACFGPRELSYAEAFYIGALRPRLNGSGINGKSHSQVHSFIAKKAIEAKALQDYPLTLVEAARALATSRRAVLDRVLDGTLNARLVRDKWRFRQSDIWPHPHLSD